MHKRMHTRAYTAAGAVSVIEFIAARLRRTSPKANARSHPSNACTHEQAVEILCYCAAQCTADHAYLLNFELSLTDNCASPECSRLRSILRVAVKRSAGAQSVKHKGR